MNTKGVVWVTVLCLCALPVSADNLLVNGSFEDGPNPGSGWFNYPAGSETIPGWVVTRSDLDYVGTYWDASDGMISLDLNGDNGPAGILQAFPTIPGAVYSVTFDLSCDPIDPLDPRNTPIKWMRVEAAGQHSDYSSDATVRSPNNMQWDTYSWEFTAANDTAQLEFYSLDPSPWWGPALDNVHVSLVPVTLQLDIDIKPGSLPNSINPGSRGVLPLAILGSEEFDVSQVDLASVELGGAAPRAKGRSGKVGSLEDIDGDSFLDLILHFDMRNLNIDPEADELVLSGLLEDGTAFEGSDSIRIVPPGDVNGNGRVDGDDLSLLLANWGPGTQWGQGNFNSDNTVNEDDLSLLLANWNASIAHMGSSAVPEPASALILLLGLPYLARRRARR